jgi:hypothetical protein
MMEIIGAQAAQAAIATPSDRRDALVLSRDELQQVTGLKRPSAMCKWLDDHGWPYEAPMRAGEMPIVAREYFQRRLVEPGAVPVGRKLPRLKPNLDFMLRGASARV